MPDAHGSGSGVERKDQRQQSHGHLRDGEKAILGQSIGQDATGQ